MLGRAMGANENHLVLEVGSLTPLCARKIERNKTRTYTQTHIRPHKHSTTINTRESESKPTDGDSYAFDGGRAVIVHSS